MNYQKVYLSEPNENTHYEHYINGDNNVLPWPQLILGNEITK